MKKNLLWIAACCALGMLTASADSQAGPTTPASRAVAVAAHDAADSKAAPASSMSAPPGGVVNLNEASSEQLELLPGVGSSRASAIVAYRKAHPFKRPEELMRVKGIGKKSFARLRPLLSLNGPTTLKERPHLASR